MKITVGDSASIERTVTNDDTSLVVGSGDVPVLATPVLLAWLEAATITVTAPTDEQTSVGARVGIDHLRPSPVGTTLTCTATVAEVDGPMVTFRVDAVQPTDGQEVLVGRGIVTRAVVDRERFMDKASG